MVHRACSIKEQALLYPATSVALSGLGHCPGCCIGGGGCLLKWGLLCPIEYPLEGLGVFCASIGCRWNAYVLFFCLIFVKPAPVLGDGGDICHVIPMSTVGR